MQKLMPVKAADRETFMDVLRGFAILGIFIANLHAFTFYHPSPATGPYLLPGADETMAFLHHVFIEGKFYSIFSLLFGWGIALQFKRAAGKGQDALPVVRRRLAFMMLLGFIHLLCWPGDIVFFYSLLGFILLLVRNWTNRQMLIAAVILLLSPILFYYLKMKFPVLNYPATLMFTTAEQVDAKLTQVGSWEGFLKLMKEGTWTDVFKLNIAGMFIRFGDLIFQSRISKVLGMFLIGYVIGRSGFYIRFRENKRLIITITLAGLFIGLPANYIMSKYMLVPGDYTGLTMNGFYQTVFYAMGVALLALSYTGLMMLGFATSPVKKLLLILSPVGKMAFTNYIMHTTIGSIVFLGAGLGYMHQVGPVYYTLFALIVFTFQVIFSTLWLSYFNYGPIEWLWRSATYKQWQPMRKLSPKP